LLVPCAIVVWLPDPDPSGENVQDQDVACGIPLTVHWITTLLSPITALCVAGVTETDNAPGKNAHIYININPLWVLRNKYLYSAPINAYKTFRLWFHG
jgi:hypothetical protein